MSVEMLSIWASPRRSMACASTGWGSVMRGVAADKSRFDRDIERGRDPLTSRLHDLVETAGLGETVELLRVS